VFQSRHPETAVRCFYYCSGCAVSNGLFFFLWHGNVLILGQNRLLQEHLRCFFFQWIDGPDKFDPRYLIFNDWWRGRHAREHFNRWVPPPPNPPPMTHKEKKHQALLRLESPPRCDYGERVVLNPDDRSEFICPNFTMVILNLLCRWTTCLYILMLDNCML
jgi:hypothetical protein